MKNRKFGGKNAVCKSKFNKFALGAVLVSSIISSACANGLFIGADGEYNFNSKYNFKYKLIENGININTLSYNYKDSSFGIGLKFGYDFDLWRIYTKFNAVLGAKDKQQFYAATETREYKWDTYNLIVGGDWTPKFNLAGLDFKGILGAFAGVSNIVLEDNFQNPSGFNNVKTNYGGFIYGAKIGGIYEIDQNNEIEFGFKIDQTNFDQNQENTATIVGMIREAEHKITNMGVFVGYNYKF